MWEFEQRNNVIVGSYNAKLAQSPEARYNPLDAGNRRFAKASLYDIVWGIGYRADDPSVHTAAALRAWLDVAG